MKPLIDSRPHTITGNAVSNQITSASHRLAVGDAVIIYTITGGAPLVVGTVYYVVGPITADTFYLSATLGGAAIDLTTDLTAGTMWVRLILAHSQREWERQPDVTGGFRESASRTARASRVISRIYLLNVVLRVTESEVTKVERLVAALQDRPSETFDFYPSSDGALGAHTCLLVHPMPPESVRFTPSDFPGLLEVSLTIRRTDGGQFTTALYYGDI